MEQNSEQNIFVEWFVWQFYEVPKFLIEVWNNYFMFATNLFSLTLLLKTFFSPWRKYNWRYPKGFDLIEFLNTLISNFFSRVVGALMRIILIIAGILFQIFVVIAGLLIFIGWLAVPFVAIFGILFFLIY
ncbi:MAG: hypothetical protein NT026_02320 [Candidatus Staskawiczbacteria bacterium]|nr:hypothetical protein [Candidatus Staskawiczbacteria bacterium]